MYKSIFVLSALALTILLSENGRPFSPKKPEAAEVISQTYADQFRRFQRSVDQLATIAAAGEDLALLRQQIVHTRLAYKRVEFLFDYFKPEFSHMFVNGPPLYKVDQVFTSQGWVAPNGLQTLDELIFSDEAADQYSQIAKLARELKQKIDDITPRHINIKMTDRSIFQALRSGLVRVFTLGLTGFDTPGSGNAIAESKESMRAMKTTFEQYGRGLDSRSRPVFQQVIQLFENAELLPSWPDGRLDANTDFDSFDRMAFLKEIINPLYERIYAFQKLAGIPAEASIFHGQNYHVDNLFDEDFLNTGYFSELSFLPLDNEATIALGKLLFHDPILSEKLDMSCATCHDPNKAFTDGLPKSITRQPGVFTRRNAPTLIDAGLSTRVFWDMREYTLEGQVVHVFEDSLEFNINVRATANRLAKSKTYTKLFEENYGSITKRPISGRTISNAIAAYINSLKSFDSPFDRFVRNETTDYPTEAIHGFNLFMGKAACGTCHFAPAFNGTVPPFYREAESEVLGVTMGFDTLQPQLDPDPGRAQNGFKRESGPHFQHSFKTVTVRNIALTAPYMHNGSFKTLEEVVEFYDKGGGVGLGLSIDNQTLPDEPLHLTEKEKAALISFLHTLTDTTGLTGGYVQLPEFEDMPAWNQRQ